MTSAAAVGRPLEPLLAQFERLVILYGCGAKGSTRKVGSTQGSGASTATCGPTWVICVGAFPHERRGAGCRCGATLGAISRAVVTCCRTPTSAGFVTCYLKPLQMHGGGRPLEPLPAQFERPLFRIHSLSLTHSLTHSLTDSLSQSRSLTFSLTVTFSLSLSPSLSLSRSLSLTHTIDAGRTILGAIAGAVRAPGRQVQPPVDQARPFFFWGYNPV